MKIAYLMTSALGDVILSTAVVGELAAKWPYASIDWIVFDCYADVLRSQPDARIVPWPLFKGIDRQAQEWDQWRCIIEWATANYDKLVIPQIYPFSPWERRPGVHMLDQQYLNANLAAPPDRLLRLPRLPDGPQRKPHVLVNSKSNTQRPVWNRVEWQAFRQAVEADDLEVIDGDAESVGVLEWRRMIDRGLCYVGLDSGGTWLAASTDTPQVCMYLGNPTCPRWLTSLRGARVKPDHLCHELTQPRPEQVAALVLEIANGRRESIRNAPAGTGDGA